MNTGIKLLTYFCHLFFHRKLHHKEASREDRKKDMESLIPRLRQDFPFRESKFTRVLFPQLKMDAFQMVVMIKTISKEL